MTHCPAYEISTLAVECSCLTQAGSSGFPFVLDNSVLSYQRTNLRRGLYAVSEDIYLSTNRIFLHCYGSSIDLCKKQPNIIVEYLSTSLGSVYPTHFVKLSELFLEVGLGDLLRRL